MAANPAQQLEQLKQQHAIENFIANATALEDLLSGTQMRVQELFGAERCTIFALDTRNRHLYSPAKVGLEFKEIRVNLDRSSITGFVGIAKRTVNIANVYEAEELRRHHPQLQFDDRWDRVSGFTTRAVLCVPVLYENSLLGTIQVINRRDGMPFSPRDVAAAEEIGRSLGLAFFHLNRMNALKEARKPAKWDALVDGGIVAELDLGRMLGEAAAQKIDPARHLIDKGGVPRAEVERSLSLFYDCDVFRFTGEERIPEEYLKRVRVDYFKRNCGAPVEKRANSVVVVIDDPGDLHRVDALRAIETGARLDLRVGLRDEILAFIEQSYGLREDVGAILRELTADEKAGTEKAEAVDDSKIAESDSAVVKLANQIISDAYKKGASDIHIEPYGRERATVVRFRVDGECVNYQEIPASYRNALVGRFKIMASLDIAERRKPQDGKIRLKVGNDRMIELRVATIPTANNNEDVVMRILAASRPLPLGQMGMSERNLEALKSIIGKPYGLILCVGPTGSGKTTTLHSVLGHINTVDTKIWTAEDPVEITQVGLRQLQVQPKIGLTFAAAIRSFLRADPDVIMVGEMRDRETAEVAIEASLTGHLVLSTLHTNTAPETVTRLIDMGLDPFGFGDALLGVVAQRLARSLCKTCREQVPATPVELDEIARAFGGEAGLAAHGIQLGAELMLWRGAGCENCGQSGYRGRSALHELLLTDDTMRRAIAARAPVADVRNLAIAGGMTTLLQDGIRKAIEGMTDLKQVLAVCSR
jgi:type II secretory ATPase GspE/PulE/Tfp pilus assembly ATPase PilB-like protein